nr:insulinase family protein [uncultured Prevotella sp.]
MKLRKFLAAAWLLLSVGSAMAQMPNAIPVDKNVRIGHLSNGLTYYIRHNNFPEHVASFYIAQKVGSINENDDQRGLAHLLEHLAFNGSEHFKDNSLQDYLQSIGVAYGRNLNAYTSVEKTVYYFTDVPTQRISAVDSCMLILKDWSNGITLSKKAIDDERDVVHNEYRMRMVGQQRMLERSLPKLYQGNKYGYRFPIGLMSVVDGCDPETLRAYYRKWYRPDNQAIIVVGDVDVDHIEAEIKKLFSGIKVPANAAKVEHPIVADNDTAIYVIDKDKEQQYDLVQVMMKHEAVPDSVKGDVSYLMLGYLDNVIAQMMGERFSDKAQEPDCPYLQASASNGEFLISSTKDAFNLGAVAKPGKVKETYAAILREAKRMHDFGFTATEYQRAKDNFMSSVDKMLGNKDKMKNEQFTSQYVDHFTSNEPIPSVEDEAKIYKTLVPQLPLDFVNARARDLVCQSDTNLVSLVMMREADGVEYPTAQQLADIVKQVRGEKLEAYVDNVKQEPLMAQKPKAGKIKKVVENKKLGFKTLTLSNGAKVIIKKTDFKDNEVLFAASAEGGYSALDKKDYINNALLTDALNGSGLGDFSSNDVSKALAGKQVGIGFSINPYSHGFNGSSTPKDLETLLQLLYLDMTALSKDQKSFDNMKNTTITMLENQSNNPNMVYQDSIQSTIYKGSMLARIPSAEQVKGINYDRLMELGKQYFGNAKDFTFFFVGNYDEKALLPLIEQYIASLPNTGVKIKNKRIDVATGEVKNIFNKEMENPQNQACEMWYTKEPFTLKTSVLANVASQLLSMKYLRTIREQLSAAYTAGASYGVIRDFDGQSKVTITASAQLNPEKSDEAVPYFFKGMDETIAAPDAADLQKAKEIMLKNADVSEKTNGYWLGVLSTLDRLGVDTHTDYKSTIKAVDAPQVSSFLKNVLKSGNHIEVIMKAVKSK